MDTPTTQPAIIPPPSEIIPAQPKKRGRPPKAPGAPKAKYTRKAKAQPCPQENAAVLPTNRDKGVCNSIVGKEQTGTTPKDTPKEDWTGILAEREKRLEEVVKTILGRGQLARVADVATIIRRTSEGCGWEKAANGLDIRWPCWAGLLRAYPTLGILYREAKVFGEEWRMDRLESITYDRATDGWQEPVFHRGEVCGHVRRFSDRLAEIHLRASNPAKYGPTADGPSSQVMVNVVYHAD